MAFFKGIINLAFHGNANRYAGPPFRCISGLLRRFLS